MYVRVFQCRVYVHLAVCVRAVSGRFSPAGLGQFIRLPVIWNRASEAEHTLHCMLSCSSLADAATVCLSSLY